MKKSIIVASILAASSMAFAETSAADLIKQATSMGLNR